jgi:CPA1 family monovalent cation:H+ antiporter
MTTLEHDTSPAAERLRLEYGEALSRAKGGDDPRDRPVNAERLQAVSAARRALDDLRQDGTIGDEAYRRVEEELDWLELSARSTE